MVGNSVRSNKVIVILTPGFPADESDSSCIPALQDYVLCLQKSFPGLKIVVLAFQYPYQKGWYKWNNIDVFSAGGKNGKLFSRIWTWKIIRSALKRIHRDFYIDVLHSFWLGEATFIAQRFAKNENTEHIATLFGQDALPSNKYLRLLNFSTMTVVANSEFTAKTFFEATHRNVNRIIYFGLKSEPGDSTEVHDRTCDILGVGSFTGIKNYELFVKIISELVRDFPDLKAIILGDGETRSLIEQRIRDCKLETVVDVKGMVPRTEVFQTMKRSKIFLHTSSYESAGTVFLEALQSGCELVCFNTGFVPSSGKSHVCKDANEMIEVLKSLLSQRLNYSSVEIPMMEETVKAFAAVYEI